MAKNLIIFDGISGVGKTTLKHAVNIKRNFEDLHICRFTPTDWVYARLNNRPIDLDELKRIERKIQEILPVLLVTLVCDPKQALKRKENMPNEVIENNIVGANDFFGLYHQDLTVFENKLILNTSEKSINECVNEITKKLELMGGWV